MTSDPSDYHREYSPYGSYPLFQFEGSDAFSVLKNSIEYSFVFFKCLIYSQVSQDESNQLKIIERIKLKLLVFQRFFVLLHFVHLYCQRGSATSSVPQ